MATFDLGRIAPLYKGDYNASTSYELNDVVHYNGNLYWHIQVKATIGVLPTDTNVWKTAFDGNGIRTEIIEYAQTASAKASEASASAQSAEVAKTAAQTAEASAQGFAQTASQKASEAAESAVQAQESVTDAQAEVTRASAEADRARAEAEQAASRIYDFLPTDTANGPVASFTDGADNVPLKSLVVGIAGTQVGSCNVVACGVNVWDEEWELGSYSTTNGEPASYTDRIRSKNRIVVAPNTEYFFKTSNGLTAGNMYFYDANDMFISSRSSRGNNVTTTPGNCRYMRIAMGLPYGATYNHNISINYPSSDHDYHPYVGQSIPISWEPTIQNGTLDVLNGILTDTDAQTEYQIEAHEVNSLFGQNNIYADTGDTSVEYRADIQRWVEKKLSTRSTVSLTRSMPVQTEETDTELSE